MPPSESCHLITIQTNSIQAPPPKNTLLKAIFQRQSWRKILLFIDLLEGHVGSGPGQPVQVKDVPTYGKYLQVTLH